MSPIAEWNVDRGEVVSQNLSTETWGPSRCEWNWDLEFSTPDPQIPRDRVCCSLVVPLVGVERREGWVERRK